MITVFDSSDLASLLQHHFDLKGILLSLHFLEQLRMITVFDLFDLGSLRPHRLDLGVVPPLPHGYSLRLLIVASVHPSF